MFEKLETLGVEREKLIQVGNLLNNYVLSFVADELVMSNLAKTNDNSFFGIPYDFDFDKQFTYGLDIILNGVQSMSLD